MYRLCCLTVLAIAVLGVTPSAHADLMIYTAYLNGPSESPPNASPGVGFAAVGFDPVAHSLSVTTVFGDLIGETTAAHVHAPTLVPGSGTAAPATMVPTFVGFPLGVTSGVYSNTFSTLLESTYNPAFVAANGATAAGAEAALAASLANGTAYFNIHTDAFPGGEIRGFLVRTVPEPSTLTLWGLCGALGLVGYGYRRRKLLRTR